MANGQQGGQSGGSGGAQQTGQEGGPVLVTEELDWRRRALVAEERVTELEGQVGECESALEGARHALDACEVRRRIERQLVEADVVDLETALMLTEAAVQGMAEPDVAAAIADLKKRKGFLFREAPVSRASAMSGVAGPGLGAATALAEEARISGDRAALLRYLRLKRGG